MYENYSLGGTTKFHIGNVYMKMKFKRFISLFLFCSLGAISALAQVEQNLQQMMRQKLQKLANPIGAMISVPFQNNMDVGIGEFNGSRNTMNFQPIVPFELSEKFNLITRYILPVITQHDITNENAAVWFG